MINFGTSAYLKLLALNPRPRDTEIGKRLGTRTGGYDFHKAMKQIAADFACRRRTWDETQSAIAAITKPAERASALSALNVLAHWLNGIPVTAAAQDRRYVSPSSLFSVKFTPDFECVVDGFPIQVHIWNTMRPAIRLREAIGVVGLFVAEDDASRLGVLSLRTGELFTSRDVDSSRQLAHLLAADVERRILRIDEDRQRPGREDRPSAGRSG